MESHLLNILHSLQSLGPWGVFLIYILASACFISLPVLALTAGAMFGACTGFFIFSFATAISSGLIFWASRRFSRGWIHRHVEKNKKVRAIDDAVGEAGWKMVALLRFTAIFPYSVMNYGLGLSKIPFWHYFLATWIAMIPGALLQAYMGAAVGELLFEGQKPQPSAFEWALVITGILASITIGVYASGKVKKILAES